MSEKTWCQHIYWKTMKDEKSDNSSWIVKRADTGFENLVAPWWNFCPVCGVKKPGV